jgi:hypothetical protein
VSWAPAHLVIDVLEKETGCTRLAKTLGDSSPAPGILHNAYVADKIQTFIYFSVAFPGRTTYSGGGVKIMTEYLVVLFSQPRKVLLNGAAKGDTNELLLLEGGKYLVSLEDPPDFTPLEQEIDLRNTSAMNPLTVEFQEA